MLMSVLFLFQNAQMSDSGNYTCRATIDENFSNQRSVLVTVTTNSVAGKTMQEQCILDLRICLLQFDKQLGIIMRPISYLFETNKTIKTLCVFSGSVKIQNTSH